MKHFAIVLTIMVLFASPVFAEKTLREIHWDAVKDAPWGQYGRVIPAKDGRPARLALANLGNEAATIPILTIENPGIEDVRWALHGKIRYQDVRGKGYLEMWSHFPNGGASFTRTLSGSGPLKSITGSSGWRATALPFYNDNGKTEPVKLTVNLRLPGTGKVELEPLTLWEYSGKQNPLTPPGAWWSGAGGGALGGVGGSVVGLCGALIGVFCSLGRARRFILTLHVLIVVVGIVSLIAGIVALLTGQTYGVWYPLFLLGGLSIVIFVPLYFTVRRRYAQLELRKIKGMDA